MTSVFGRDSKYFQHIRYHNIFLINVSTEAEHPDDHTVLVTRRLEILHMCDSLGDFQFLILRKNLLKLVDTACTGETQVEKPFMTTLGNVSLFCCTGAL